MRLEEIRPLTGLRFLIAFWVFIFHIQIRWPIFDNFVLVEIANQGAIGMTFFFVLSGFILSYTNNTELEVSTYFRSRLARIYPIYILVAILTLPWLVLPSFIGKQPSFLEITFLLQLAYCCYRHGFHQHFLDGIMMGVGLFPLRHFFIFAFPH